LESKLFWRETFKIRAYEAGVDGRVSIQAITNYLLESASNHAAHMDVSVQRLFEMNLTWVLSRFHVRMKRYPRWPETVTVETWPAHKDILYAIRDFRLLDSKGNEIGVASSSWMMIDFKARKPVALPDFIEGLENKEAGRTLEDPFERMPKVTRVDAEKEFRVRQSDLDVNRHVYSVHYLSWALEAVPPEVWKNYRISDVEINFRAESLYGDFVISGSEMEQKENQVTIIHQLKRRKDDKELTRLRTTWQLK
jgi:acyl-ACP thioesterase